MPYVGSNEDLGAADLRYQGSAGGDYYDNEDIDARTYRLQSNEDDDQLNSYDDLATFIAILNGRHASDVDFDSPEFEQAIEKVFDVPAFLRWASVNMLLGAWDNYWGTPANYYLYNSGVEQDGDLVAEPFFTWIDQSVWLEADGPQHQPHTGRQFTNDQVYWNGFRHDELTKDGQFTMGIWHYVNARRDSAASQIAGLRAEHGLTPPPTPVCN